MTAGWVAGSVRGRGLCRRRLGLAGARAVAASGSTDAAVAAVARSPYGREVRPGMPLADASRAVAAVCLWHLRVLAGWLPPRSGDAARVFAARFEIDNVGDRLASLAGLPVGPAHPLGALAVAWPRVVVASTPEEVRGILASSAWGDPGSADWPMMATALEARWASWLADVAPYPWAAGAAALVAARTWRDSLGPSASGDLRRLLGPGWESARDLGALAAALPTSAAWVLDGVERAGDLWRADGTWWRRVDQEAAGTLQGGRAGPAVAIAAAARLVVDARRVQAALEAAAWGPDGLEAFDALV